MVDRYQEELEERFPDLAAVRVLHQTKQLLDQATEHSKALRQAQDWILRSEEIPEN